MEITQPISSDELDLAPVFGELDDDTKERVLEQLRRADATLASVRDELDFEGVPITLEQYPSGQTEIAANLKGAAGKLSFEAGLRPRNFFSESPWHPGRAPRSMMTDAWDIDGAIRITVRKLVGTHKYTIQEAAEEIDEQRFEEPVEAAAAFAAVCERLAELARSREATVEAWTPPEEDDG
jgi:hypothetical protein